MSDPRRWSRGTLRVGRWTAVLALFAPGLVLVSPTAAQALPTSGHIDFGTQTSTPFSGYSLDYGLPYDATRGYGWEDNSSGTASTLVGNGRQRNSNISPDSRYDTFIQMQQTSTGSGGVLTVGRWEYAIANGAYSVTVAVGDPTATNSTYSIIAERGTANQVTMVNAYVPTTAQPFQTVTKQVTVTDGKLTLDPTGGTNDKLDFVDIVPAPPDTTPPTGSVSLSGTFVGGTTYSSAVTFTVTAADEAGGSGVGPITYTVDGGASQTYSGPTQITATGSHTLVVTISDLAGNTTTKTSTFTISTPSAPTSAHVDFGAQTTTAFSGYVLDYGQSYDTLRGFGWEDIPSGSPLSLVGNGRQRNSALSPDARYDTLMQMQQSAQSSGGTTTPGKWEARLANGTYNVTVAVGDVTATNSVDMIVAEKGTPNAVTVINSFVPTSNAPFQTVSKVVVVNDGALTLDPTGGTNTKLDFVDVTPAATDTTPPTLAIGLSGALAGDGSYTGSATATLTAADESGGSGLSSVTYTLDGGTPTSYTAPVKVTALGAHTLSATATDAAGNATTKSATFTVSAPPLPTSGHVDFGTQTSTPFSGYVLDYGQAFDSTRGYGWEDNSSGSPSTLVGNGRQRNSSASPDSRYDNFIQVQQTSTGSGGVLTVGRWEYALANGTYNVTVAVGDPTALNSTYTVTAERATGNQTTIVNGYVPTAAAPFQTVTKLVTVTDGALTLDPTGGTNGKIDFVDIAKADVTPPTLTTSISGALVSGSTYASNVSVTLTAADESGGSGLASLTYTLDGGATTTYSGPVTVTTDGNHTLVAKATDGAGNVTTKTVTWTEQHDTTAPTASISLAGTLVSGTTYSSSVTATVNAADDPGGSGVATTTYSLDGGPTTTYGGPVTVTVNGNHTLTATVTDVAGNTATATSSWTQSAPDTTPPSVSIGLAGTLSAGTYYGTVTATVTAADEPGGSGVATTTYSLDGGPTTAYAGPITVTADGTHTLTATATDGAGNVGSVTQTWSELHDTTPPLVAVATGGQRNGNGVFNDVVTATVTSSDDSSGVTAVTYTLDGGAATAYTGPVTVYGSGSHTLTATATDGAGNAASATSTIVISTDPLVVSGHVDFGTQTSTPFSGYALDYGQAFDATRGYGWEDNSNGAASSLVGNGRQRNSSASPDSRYDNFIQVQQTSTGSGGVLTVGRWEYALGNGTYNVTVGVGDPTATNSTYTVTAERGTANQTTIINGYVPTTAAPFQTVTKHVTVTDNRLTLDPTGGTNGKIDFVDITPTADTTPPTNTVALTGPSNGGTYYGTVSITDTSFDEPGGSGLASTMWTLDGSAPTSYSGPIQVPGDGNHTFSIKAVDNAGNVSTRIVTWIEQHDVTAPTATVSIAGTQDGGGSYGTVTVTITGTDNAGGSGIGALSYSLDGAASATYSGPFTVATDGSHTITATATDRSGNASPPASTSWTELHTGPPHVVVTAADSTALGLPTARVVFSASMDPNQTAAAPRKITFTNTGTGTLQVTNLAIGGTNASSFALAPGQPTSFSVPVGGSVDVSIVFTPTATTGCPNAGNVNAIGDSVRIATLTYSTNDTDNPTGTANLGGLNACYTGGNNEPVLDQMIQAFGYTTVTDSPNANEDIMRRNIGPLRYLPSTDEIQSPYFTAADSSKPVSLVPLAHYSGADTSASGYSRVGWIPKGTAWSGQCTSTCQQLFLFPPDPSTTSYGEQQKLWPVPTGTTSFTPSTPFAIYQGDTKDANFSDDSFNIAQTPSYQTIVPLHLLHSVRIFPAFGPGHVQIPNTYIVGVDITREPFNKNNDFQDVVMVMRNVNPLLAPAPLPGTAGLNRNLTSGITVGSDCTVTGFDGVLANTAGTQCNAANISATGSGLALASTAGQLTSGDQQNALFNVFDATHGAFTVRARVVGPITNLTANFQQIAAFFGPDQSNFIKVEAEHNGSADGDPHLTMFYDEKGVSSTVASVSVPGLTTASTVDLIIKGNTQVPDPTPSNNDPSLVRGFPIDELTVWYSINGAAPVQIGSTYVSPADVTSWFSTRAKAGILVSNTGTSTPITATFSQLQISNG